MWSLFDGQDVLNEIDPAFSANIARHVRRAQLLDPFHVSANTDPKGNRSLRPQDQDPDVLLHVVSETDNGIVVRGAKFETAAAYANQAFVKRTIGEILQSRRSGPQMREPIRVGGHLRIRPFNTADSYPEQRLDNDLCQAVVAGETVYLRGQVAQNLDTGESVHIGNPAAQAEQVMTNIETLLAEAGASVEHVVACTVYLTDIRHREPVYRVVGRRLKGVYPVFTGLVVSALARPEWLVEVTVVAVKQ